MINYGYGISGKGQDLARHLPRLDKFFGSWILVVAIPLIRLLLLKGDHNMTFKKIKLHNKINKNDNFILYSTVYVPII